MKQSCKPESTCFNLESSRSLTSTVGMRAGLIVKQEGDRKRKIIPHETGQALFTDKEIRTVSLKGFQK